MIYDGSYNGSFPDEETNTGITRAIRTQPGNFLEFNQFRIFQENFSRVREPVVTIGSMVLINFDVSLPSGSVVEMWDWSDVDAPVLVDSFDGGWLSNAVGNRFSYSPDRHNPEHRVLVELDGINLNEIVRYTGDVWFDAPIGESVVFTSLNEALDVRDPSSVKSTTFPQIDLPSYSRIVSGSDNLLYALRRTTSTTAPSLVVIDAAFPQSMRILQEIPLENLVSSSTLHFTDPYLIVSTRSEIFVYRTDSEGVLIDAPQVLDNPEYDEIHSLSEIFIDEGHLFVIYKSIQSAGFGESIYVMDIYAESNLGFENEPTHTHTLGSNLRVVAYDDGKIVTATHDRQYIENDPPSKNVYHVISIENLARPQTLGAFEEVESHFPAFFPNHFRLHKSLLAMSGEPARVLDISNPNSFQNIDLGINFDEVYWIDDLLYGKEGNEITIFSFSDSGQATVVDSFTLVKNTIPAGNKDRLYIHTIDRGIHTYLIQRDLTLIDDWMNYD